MMAVIAFAEFVRAVAVFVVGGVLLIGVGFAARWVARWLGRAIADDIRDGIGHVVREQLADIQNGMTALEERDAAVHAEVVERHGAVMLRLDEVEERNTADHGEVSRRLQGVEDRLASVERKLAS